MKVVTVVSNEEHFGFFLLKLSCAVNDLELVSLVSKHQNFKTRRFKDDLLNSYLDSVPDEEIIIFTDGYDTIFTTSEEEILAKFNNTKKDLFFSAETGCWPDVSLADRYAGKVPGPYKYLNSGGFIGKAGLIKELLQDQCDEVKEEFKESNQYLWTHRFFKHPHIIGLDTSCEIFCSFSPEVGQEHLPEEEDGDYYPYYQYKVDWFESNFLVDNGRVFNRITQTWPCNLHFNGNSKCLMNKKIIDMIFNKLPNADKIRTLYEAAE